jgi:hypothetical protein
MFFAPGHVFGSAKGVESRFHVLRSRTLFRRFRWPRVPFSCFTSPYSFSAVPWASGPVFMICAPRLIFGGAEGVDSYFHVLRSQTLFRRYRRRRVPFSCFALPDSFSTLPRESGPIFIFCALRLVFGGTEGVGSRCQVLRARTHFWRYLRRRVPYSCFALSDTFSAVRRASGSNFNAFRFETRFHIFAVPRASGPVFIFLRSQIRFRWFRRRRVLFSSFAFSHSFSAVPRASGLVFMFYAPELVLDEPRALGSVFMFCALGLIFRRYLGRRVSFSCFTRPNSFSAVPTASGPVFKF